MGPVVQSRRGDRKEIRSALTGRAGTFEDLGMEAWTFQGDGTNPTEKGGFFHLQKDLGMEYVSYPEGKVYWINLCGNNWKRCCLQKSKILNLQ